jgi:hypothetical protein
VTAAHNPDTPLPPPGTTAPGTTGVPLSTGHPGRIAQPPVCLATIGFFLVHRLAEDYVIVPRIIGHAVQVPAVVTVVAALLGGALQGINESIRELNVRCAVISIRAGIVGR